MTRNTPNGWSISTRAVHHAQPKLEAAPLAAPLFQTSTFRADQAATIARFAGEIHPKAYYTRWGNPTVASLESVVADLEGGECCLGFASGMAAVTTTLLGLLAPGDHVVAGASLYAATTEVLSNDLTQLGVDVDFVDPTEPEAFSQAIRHNTAMVYLETPANPTMALTDLAAVCACAKQHGAICVVDNTFATPYNQNPLSMGADVVLHSATKYLSGHGDVVAGCLVTRTELAERLWHKRTMLGGCLDPFAAWLALRGIKTFALRMERHNENAMAVAPALESHPAVSRVFYPGLESHPQHELAARQMRGFGGMVAFEVAGGREAGQSVVESTRLAVLAVSLGSVETLIEHAASMSHAPLSDEQLRQAGIPPGLIRLSVGIEDPNDLIDDLRQALDR